MPPQDWNLTAGPARRIAWALALAVAVAVYAPHLRNGYVWDDLSFIQRNPAVSGETPLGTALSRHLWAGVLDGAGAQEFQYWRPAFLIAMRLAWAAGDGAPAAFHLASLLLHLATATLALLLLPRLGLSRGVALAAAALLLVHPLSGEAVYWAAALSEPMLQASLLGALLASVRARDAEGRVALAWRGAAVLASAVAVFTKETGVVVPLLVTAEALRAPRPAWRARLASAWAVWLPVPAYVALRAAVLDGRAGGALPGDLVRRIGRAGEMLAWDFRRLAFPLPLSPMHALPEPTAASTALGLATLAVVAAAVAALAWWRPRGLFWAAWVLVPLLPPLAQVFASRGMPFLVAERYLLVSLVPVLALQAAGVAWLAARLAPRAPAALAAAGAAAFVAAAVPTAAYGRAYLDDPAYFAWTLEVHPDDPTALLHTGRFALERGDVATALPYLEASARRAPRPITATFRGLALRAAGRDGEALAAFGDALRMDGTYLAARLARADLLRDLGRVDEAGPEYARAAASAPSNPDARLGAGTWRFLQGDVAGAVEHWEAGLAASPRSCELLFNAGLAWWKLGQPERGRERLSGFLSACGEGFEAQRAQARAVLAR